MQEQELAITVDAHVDVQLEVEHLHEEGRLVPMIEVDLEAEISETSPSSPPAEIAARVNYRCPDCQHVVSIRAHAASRSSPRLAADGFEVP